MYGHRVDTIMSGHKCVWAQTYLGTNVRGHSHVVTVVWAQSCIGSNVVEPDVTEYFIGEAIF